MKLSGLIKLLLLLLCIGTNGQERPYGTMVEFLRDPGNTPVMDLFPEFSWIVPAKAGKQTAWQIELAGSEKDLEKNLLLWDSRKTKDQNSAAVEYTGVALKPNTRYLWRVRIWDSKDKASDWSEIQSFVTGDPAGYLTTGNRMLRTYIKPERFVKIADGKYFADFGKDAFGRLVLYLKSPSEKKISVQLGEKLSGQNTIDANPGGTIRYYKTTLNTDPSTDRHIVVLPADQRNTGPAAIHLPDSMGVVVPFRYALIEYPGLELTPDNISRETWSYYFDDTESYFTSSDTILNQVWDICKYSMKATSFAGFYIDGDRERIPYEADAYINQLGHYYTDREYSLARRTNDYFMEHPTWPTEWILHTVLMFYNDLMFTGDTEALEYWYTRLKNKTLTSLARADGLISAGKVTDEIMKEIGFKTYTDKIRDIVDWPPAQKDTGWKLATSEGERDGYEMTEINTMVNAFYYRNLVLMSQIAGLMGKQDDSVMYGREAVRVRAAFNDKLLSRETGIYIDGEGSQHSSLHANMTALAFGLVPEANRKRVIDFIKTRGMACSVYGSQYLLEGLYDAGEAEYAQSLISSTGSRSWWNMIRSGSTITLEAWDMKYKPNSDWNHAWGAAPANIIPGYLWGIKPTAPGFSKAVIRPQLGNLSTSKIIVPMIRGPIKAQYRLSGESEEYLIELPGNLDCDFIVPEGEHDKIILNGKKIPGNTVILSLKPGINKILL